jgi:hemerythrin-like domain-containing protein
MTGRRAPAFGKEGAMRSIRSLTREHGLILQQLENLGTARQRIEAGQWPPVEFFEAALAFAREFADRFHHFKEEFLLFGMLARSEGGRLDAEIGALRFQHERCRQALDEMERALPGYRVRDEFAATALAIGLSGYLTLLRRHIALEEDVFFPLAAGVLTEQDDAELLRHFSEDERSAAGDVFETSRQKVEEMSVLLRSGVQG